MRSAAALLWRYAFPPAGTSGVAADPSGGQSRYVALCEVDRFEAIRRNIGYATANALILRLSQRIGDHLAGAMVRRVGRTTVELLFAAETPEAAGAEMTALCDLLGRPIEIDGYTFDLRVRIAFARFVGPSLGDEVIGRLEAALANTLAAHRRVVPVDPATAGAEIGRLPLMRDLQRAVAQGDLELHYQPKLRCRTRTVDSVEALIRWHHPSLGAISPDEFIRIAEETGLIRQLTDWVIDRAIADQARLAEAGHMVAIHINISGLLLPKRDFVEAAIARTSAAKGRIGFEITETAVIEDPERALANLALLRAAGIAIAIDDYGSGLSSLAYLKQLPAQELKIDKLFISGLTTSHRDPLLVRSSIDLAHALEMEVTAEGVEDPMTMSLLSIMGCDLLQGYLIAPALPLGALITFLDRDDHGDHIDRLAAPPSWRIAS